MAANFKRRRPGSRRQVGGLRCGAGARPGQGHQADPDPTTDADFGWATLAVGPSRSLRPVREQAGRAPGDPGPRPGPDEPRFSPRASRILRRPFYKRRPCMPRHEPSQVEM